MIESNEVREVLFCQMKILHERSKDRGLPLIALDGLSREMAQIGKVLLDNSSRDYLELVSLTEIANAAQAKVGELRERVGQNLDGTDSPWQDVYDQLDELHALLHYREGGA